MTGSDDIFGKVEKAVTRLAEATTFLAGLLLLIAVILTVASIAGRAMISVSGRFPATTSWWRPSSASASLPSCPSVS